MNFHFEIQHVMKSIRFIFCKLIIKLILSEFYTIHYQYIQNQNNEINYNKKYYLFFDSEIIKFYRYYIIELMHSNFICFYILLIIMIE